MRKKIIAGNWKMNGDKASIAALLKTLSQADITQEQAEMMVFPPFVFLNETEDLLQKTSIAWGAQNLSLEKNGAFTGEISAEMLLDFACRYVLVGHSERRQLFGETNEIVAKKFMRALEAGLSPVLCLGETLAERQAEKTLEVIMQQLDAVLSILPQADLLTKAIIAYEPVWAIGTGLTATPEQAQEVHAAIRSYIAKFAPNLAAKLPILYGGSVKSANAEQLFAMPDIDGGLIGGASLDAQEFLKIFYSAR